MDNQAYLVFHLCESQYGIEAALVREIFPLPELTPITEAPPDMIGFLNLRGKIIPIMHLACRLGQAQPTCQLSNAVILLDWQGLQVGMVVDRVQDVFTLDAAALDRDLNYGRNPQTPLMKGVTKYTEDPIILLNPDALIRHPDQVASLAWEAELAGLTLDHPTDEMDVVALHQQWEALLADEAPELEQRDELADPFPRPPLGTFFEQYCPTATAEEKEIFRQRATALQSTDLTAVITDQQSLAVVGLGQQYFGLDLRLVREFIDLREVTPIPCCPNHIVGNINLRGEVMTLVDIQAAFKMGDISPSSVRKAVIFEVDDVVAGITVDEVLDITTLSTDQIAPIPAALPTGYREYLQGTTAYEQQHINILDLPKLISQGMLHVNQS